MTKKKDESEIDEPGEKVAPTQGGAVVVSEEGYDDDSDSGFEGSDQADYSLAFISITQDLSKTVKSGQHEVGMIYNSATSKVIAGEDGISFIPVLRQRKYVEWIDLKKGGGRVGDFAPEDPIVTDIIAAAKDPFDLMIGENHLVETFYMYGVVVSGDSYYEACIPFKGAMIRKYKGWMVELRGLKFTKKDESKATYPFFAHRWKLSTIPQTSPGGDFFNWEVNFDGENAAACRLPSASFNYQLAKKLHQYLTSDAANINFAKENDNAGETEKTDEM